QPFYVVVRLVDDGLHTLLLSSCFFFSSRRRHTRFSRDWSSDVCSSDLKGIVEKPFFLRLDGAEREEKARRPGQGRHHHEERGKRSEERRVGKECRSRWSPYQSEKRVVRRKVSTRRHAHTQQDKTS